MTSLPFFMLVSNVYQHTNADDGRLTSTRVFFPDPFTRWAVFVYGQDMHVPTTSSRRSPITGCAGCTGFSRPAIPTKPRWSSSATARSPTVRAWLPSSTLRRPPVRAFRLDGEIGWSHRGQI